MIAPTADWSHSPFPRVMLPDEVRVAGDSLGSGGESSGVHRLAPPHQDWVFKRYSASVPCAPLALLIDHPDRLTPDRRSIVDRHTAWPVARVDDDSGMSVGVVMPAAPDPYWATIRLPSGKSRRRLLDVDLMARDSTRQQLLGLPVQTLTDRLAVCAAFTSIAALLEEAGLVYLDWSFANVLWSTADHTTFLIDIDGATFGPRQQIGTHMFDDPLVSMGAPAGPEVDRYRVALLVAWCLTGRSPDRPRMLDDINTLATTTGPATPAATLIERTLHATHPSARVPIQQLHDALRQATAPTAHDRFVLARDVVASGEPEPPAAGSGAGVGHGPRPPAPVARTGGRPGGAARRTGPGSIRPTPRRTSLAGIGLVAALIVLLLVVVGLMRDRTSSAGSTPAAPPAAPTVPATSAVEPAPATFVEVRVTPAGVTVPATAETGQDDANRPVSYSQMNLFDGDPSTCWRMDGDGTGRTITIDLGAATTVTAVGLVPGYAKQDPTTGVDRFVQNRRVVKVTWASDDGVTMPQEFTDSPTMQTVPMFSATRYLRLTIGGVTPDGGRDFTAISEIELVGHQ
jgi:hypothetical protein